MTPARNRVSPRGSIIAVPGCGAWMGNRGRLHEGSGARDIVRDHQDKAWITSLREFKGRYSQQWAPTHYTQLFFLDEAVAFAAGHRPCAECRRGDYRVYQRAWQQNHGGAMPYAKDVDAVLRRERTGEPQKLSWSSMPMLTDYSYPGPQRVPCPYSPHRRVWRCCAPATRCRSISPARARRAGIGWRPTDRHSDPARPDTRPGS